MSSASPNVFRLVSHMLAALFNNRSAFRREWQRFEKTPAKPNSVEGHWSGEWVSDISGHRGELKCVLVPISADKYRAFFHAGFSKLFRVAYATELNLQRKDGHTSLVGQQDLGSLAGGVYRCEGEIRGTNFNCKYSCKYDQGIFRLHRVD
ncbi:MAG TPA: hypothetical protein VL793_11170 [Patescibacteria group bacterium]|nr:hypothetical protein [Patescibacteria group bacterium]